MRCSPFHNLVQRTSLVTSTSWLLLPLERCGRKQSKAFLERVTHPNGHFCSITQDCGFYLIIDASYPRDKKERTISTSKSTCWSDGNSAGKTTITPHKRKQCSLLRDSTTILKQSRDHNGFLYYLYHLME